MGDHDLLDIPKIFNNAIPILFSKTKCNRTPTKCVSLFLRKFSQVHSYSFQIKKRFMSQKVSNVPSFLFSLFLSEGENKESDGIF